MNPMSVTGSSSSGSCTRATTRMTSATRPLLTLNGCMGLLRRERDRRLSERGFLLGDVDGVEPGGVETEDLFLDLVA